MRSNDSPQCIGSPVAHLYLKEIHSLTGVLLGREFAASSPREIEPLMGWTSSADTRRQVTMHFPSKEEAIAYAERHGIAYRVERPKERQVRPKSYADNFRFDRRVPWSH